MILIQTHTLNMMTGNSMMRAWWKALWKIVVVKKKMTPILMRYMQLKAEGRDEEAQQLAEASSFLPISNAWC